MAIKRLVEDAVTGKAPYGVLEKNAVVYPRTGNIMAMFGTTVNAENGMLLGVDYAKNEIVLPGTTEDIIALVDSCEKEYYDEVIGLNSYALGNGAQYFKPRMGILSINDRFTTSTVSYDTEDYADLDAIKDAVEDGLYGIPCADGTIRLADSTGISAAKVVLKAEKVDKLANNDNAIKFAVIKAN